MRRENKMSGHKVTGLRDVTLMHKQDIIDFIREYRAGHEGVSPTLREIADSVFADLNSQSQGNAHRLVEQLINEGFLRKVADGQRTLVLVEPQPRPYYYKREEQVTE